MFDEKIMKIINSQIENASNYLRITYDESGDILESSEPIKISDGHWVNIISKKSCYEFEHVRTVSNISEKSPFDIASENQDINEKLLLQIKNKQTLGKIIIK